MRPWYVRPAVRDHRGIAARRASVFAISAFAIAGCGGPPAQDADEPEGEFNVEVVEASFPTQQRLAQESQMRIVVRNAGDRAIPDVAVTVEPVQDADAPAALAFEEGSRNPRLASASRPVWILDSGPPGGVTAYTNTWALGQLAPGATKHFVWNVTAVKGGAHTVRYTVAAGLDGKARAILPGGGRPSGEFQVNISDAPSQGGAPLGTG